MRDSGELVSKLEPHMLSSFKVKQYPPVNCCIYCGRSEGKLTNEHIVMYGLGGKAVLPKASCSACGRITSQIEQFVSREMWGPFRVLTSIQSRNKQRPSEIAYTVQSPGATYARRRLLPVGNHPAWLHFPKMPEPEFFTGVPLETFDTWSRIYNQEGILRWKGKRVYVGAIDLQLFSRFLAKIAHSFACAEIGMNNFTPLVREAILGQHVRPSLFVGSFQHELPAEEGMLHRQQMVDIEHCGVNYKGVRLRLFANFGAPEYVVIVGATSSTYPPSPAISK